MIKKTGIILSLLIFFALGNLFAQSKSAGNLSTEERYNLAVGYYAKEDRKSAHNIFREIVGDEPVPYKAIVYFNMGMCLQIEGIAQKEKGDKELAQALFAQAEIYYRTTQEILPYFPQLYSNEALVAFYQNKPKDIIQQFFDAGQQLTNEWGAFPPDVENEIYSYRSNEVLLSIAVNYLAAGKFQDAADMLRDVIAKMNNAPPKKDYMLYTAYNSLGLALFALNDTKGAIDALESSVKIAPSQPKLDVSYANLGMLYYRINDYPKAAEAVAKALALNSDNQTAREYQEKLKARQWSK